MKYENYKYIKYKQVVQLLAFLVFIFFIWYYYHDGLLNPGILEKYLTNYPVASVGLFMFTYSILVIASLPTLPLNLAAGFFWGSLLGGFYAAVAVTIGGWVSFRVARSVFGKRFTKKFDSKIISRIQQGFDNNGWKFVAFVRLTPILPTGPINYLLGLTSISNITFLWSTLVFLQPVSIAIAYIGYKLNSFDEKNLADIDITWTIITVSAILAFLVAIKYISKIIKNT